MSMFTGESIRLQALGGDVVELCFDRRGEAINKFDVRTVDELATAIDELLRQKDFKGLMVTSAKSGFIVGADIFEFGKLFAQPEPEIEAHIAAQNAVFRRLEDLNAPIVTAINGIALGGGLEMALTSDFRVMAETAQVGLPEVNLGLFPGYGGTVRLSRLAGSAVAIDWVTTGKVRSAKEALAAGVADEVVRSEILRAAARARLDAAIACGDWNARRASRRGPVAIDAAAVTKARERLAPTARHQPAALAAVELIASCAALSYDAALKREHREFARIARTQAAASLIQLFISEQRVKSKDKANAREGCPVRNVGVLGAGIMGAGIAYSSAVKGLPVLMKDVSPKALEQGIAQARQQLERHMRSGRLPPEQATRTLESIRPQRDYAGFGELDLVIEAVVEDLALKHQLLAEVEPLLGARAILASNTSSLSITTLAQTLKRPEQFIGLHFFNPVPQMPLVEVVRGPQTATATAATASSYVATLGKTPIVVRDCPGFLVNRILTAYLVGFLRAVRDGADFTLVDRVMEAFGWPMGPAYLQDVVGLDTLLRVVETITAGHPQRMRLDFEIAPTVLVADQRLGQKNGKGYYRYEPDPSGRAQRVADSAVPELLAALQPAGPREFSEQEILERLMLPMLIEAALCLEEQVAESAEEIDLALVLGLGFPRHAGGALKYMDWLGVRFVTERCDRYRALGPLYVPSVGMSRLAASGGRYFP
jgi:3-hydroxyacyl-CoA dehydrogenase/enoyl-CoA hydratase/3-hydroxybutyryl-CoA epimerase/enoyl-CoA isomerase